MKEQVISKLSEAINKIGAETNIELTPSKGHGDFSTNVAMKLAGQLKDSPINIANKIIENLEADFIDHTEVAGPGFINIFLKGDTIANTVKNIINSDSDFGRGTQNKFINVEYVSANPTGYLHIGHARNAVLGSTLVNILRFAGNKVDAEYYINDAGNQINVLGESVRVRYLQELGIDAKLPESSYAGEDIKVVAKWFVEKYNDSLKDESLERFKDESKNMFLEIIKQQLKDYNIVFDIFSSEQKIYDEGKIDVVLDLLKEHTFKEDGALWLDTESQGDDKNRVLVKSDGAYTYLTPDIAYHKVKLDRGYDELINVWGADHIGYIKRMEVALSYLGLSKERLDILTVQLVKLSRDGEEVKMSKRLGTTYTIKELLEEIGSDAARWFMIDRSNTSSFSFDINDAKKQSSENPVYTVQYTHARTNQLLNKSNVTPIPGKYDDKEKELINHISKFPDLINSIANSHKVHMLPQFLLELSGQFNSWYSNTKVIGNEEEASKLALALAVKIVLKNGLELLGISAPDQM